MRLDGFGLHFAFRFVTITRSQTPPGQLPGGVFRIPGAKAEKVRARISFPILQQIATWRVQTIPVPQS